MHFHKILTIAPLLIAAQALALEIPTVLVGNRGNEADAFTGLGKVDYPYEISKYEITNEEFCEFLNARASNEMKGAPCIELSLPKTTDENRRFAYMLGLKDITFSKEGPAGSKYLVKAGAEKMPVILPVQSDLLIGFVDWLNGRETYAVSRNKPGIETTRKGQRVINTIKSLARRDYGGETTWVIPTRNEYFKAAFHDKSQGTRGVYFAYATGSNFVPNGCTESRINELNFSVDSDKRTHAAPKAELMAIGASSPSPYGAFDLTGNAAELTEEGMSDPDLLASYAPDVGVPKNRFGGSYESYGPFINRLSSIQQISLHYQKSRHTFTTLTENYVGGKTGFRLVRVGASASPLKSVSDQQSRTEAESVSQANHLASCSDGDVWLYQLQGVNSKGSAVERVATIIKAREKMASKSPTGSDQRPASSTKKPSKEERSVFDAFKKQGLTCAPLYDFAMKDTLADLRVKHHALFAQNLRGQSGAKSNPRNGEADAFCDYVVAARKTDAAGVSELEQTVTKALQANTVPIWYFAPDIVGLEANSWGSESTPIGIIIGINSKTHELLVRVIESNGTPEVTPMVRIKSDAAYAGTIGLYRIES